jgi:hypothetical protein
MMPWEAPLPAPEKSARRLVRPAATAELASERVPTLRSPSSLASPAVLGARAAPTPEELPRARTALLTWQRVRAARMFS